MDPAPGVLLRLFLGLLNFLVDEGYPVGYLVSFLSSFRAWISCCGFLPHFTSHSPLLSSPSVSICSTIHMFQLADICSNAGFNFHRHHRDVVDLFLEMLCYLFFRIRITLYFFRSKQAVDQVDSRIEANVYGFYDGAAADLKNRKQQNSNTRNMHAQKINLRISANHDRVYVSSAGEIKALIYS